MFLVILRPLIIIAVILLIAYFARKKVRKLEITEPRRERLEDALTSITETINESKSLPDINKAKLEKARSQINELLNEKRKDERIK